MANLPLALQIQMPEFTTPQEFEAQRLGQERARYSNELQRMRLEEERQRPEVMNKLSQMMAEPGAIGSPEKFFGMGEQGKSAYEALHQAQQFKEQQETKKKANIGSALSSAILDPSDSGMEAAYKKLEDVGIPSEPYRQIFSSIPEDQRRLKLLSYAVSSPEGMKLLNFASPKFEERSSATEKWFEDINPYSPTFGKKQSNVEAMPSMAQVANLMNAYTNAGLSIPSELLSKFGGVGVAAKESNLQRKKSSETQQQSIPSTKGLTEKEQTAINIGVQEGRVDPNKINSKNAKIIAGMLTSNPGINLIELGVSASGAAASERSLAAQTAKMSTAANEATKMVDVVRDLTNKIDRTQYPTINSIVNAVDKGTGGKEIVQLNTSLNALVNSYARAISPTGQPTVSDKNHAREIINSAYSRGQIGAILDVMQQEMDIARHAAGTASSELRSMRETQRGRPPAQAPATAPSAAPKAKFLGFE